MKKRRKLTKRIQRAKQDKFLKIFAELGNVRTACETAKVGRSTHYEWLQGDEKYAERFRIAEDMAVDTLEAEARRRAHEGWEEPVFYKGQLAGVWLDAEGKPAANVDAATTFKPHGVRKFSDTLLIFLLKAARPERFREHFEHSLGDKTVQTLADVMKRAASNG